MSSVASSTLITPVILCGGSGTRLWPLNRKSFPKQFLPLIRNKRLLQLTLERVSLFRKTVICVASDEHRFLVAEAMEASKVQGTVLLEPVARNTAAAMATAALAAKPEDLLLLCPSDHHIPDAAAFALVVKQGVAAAQTGAIVTFGITATFPSTAYGYIRQGGNRPDGAFNVEEFTEKPAQDKADAFLVASSSHVEQVKQVVARLDADNISQSAQHRKVARPWGAYDSLDLGGRHQVKRITVRPCAKFSLQMHHHRAEHWIVVKGTAMVTLGEEEVSLEENQSTYIPLGVKHRLENPGKTDLALIEVQSGSHLGQDDIVRFEDTYGRTPVIGSAPNPVIASEAWQSIS